MKNIIAIIILFLMVSCASTSINQTKSETQKNQNQKFEYDADFVEFVKNKWNSKEYEKADLPKFDKFKALYVQLKKGNENILSDYFIEKPDNNILLAEYLNTKLKWNMFNRGKEKLTTEKVIEKVLSNLPERNEMLAFYYKTIFVNILNNQREIEPYERNLDFKELRLNETEGAILFLTAMRHLGRQMSGYSNSNFPKNCFRAHLFFKKIPTFNGKFYTEFELPDFKDFVIEVDKRYPKVSFKKYYTSEYENAKNDYLKCINN